MSDERPRVTFVVQLWCDICQRVIGRVRNVKENDPSDSVVTAMTIHSASAHPDL